MIKRWSYASAAASGGELWESRILDRLSFVSFWIFLVCITCWCKQHGWMLLIPVSLSYKKLSYKKTQRWPTGPLYSVIFVASVSSLHPRTCSHQFRSEMIHVASTKVPECPPLFFGMSLSDSNMLQVRHHKKTPRSPMAVWSDIVLVGETLQSGRR